MSTAENTAIVRRYVEAVWNERNRTLINEVIADGVRLFFRMIDAAFPDARMTIEDMIAEGDRVVWRFSLRATHTGSFQGIPATGRSVTITGMNIVLVADAQVTQARYGPVLALAIWDGEERAPLYLVSNLGVVSATCADRDLLFGPEEPRLPHREESPWQSGAAGADAAGGLPGLLVDDL